MAETWYATKRSETNQIGDQWRDKISTKDLSKPNLDGNPSGKEQEEMLMWELFFKKIRECRKQLKTITKWDNKAALSNKIRQGANNKLWKANKNHC